MYHLPTTVMYNVPKSQNQVKFGNECPQVHCISSGIQNFPLITFSMIQFKMHGKISKINLIEL